MNPAEKSLRSARVGSTEIAAIVAHYRPELAHLSKRKNAADIWLRLVHGIDTPWNPRMRRGISNESILRDLYRETVGPVSDPPGVLPHPGHKWACGSPDGLGTPPTTPGLVELKTSSIWALNQWGEPGSDKVPDNYSLQVQWLMSVTDTVESDVLVGFGQDATDEAGHPDFVFIETAVYRVPRDEQLVSMMLELGSKFYTEHVIPRVAPIGVVPVSNKRAFKRLTNG